MQVSTADGCSALDTATVAQHALPLVKLEASDICLGDTLTIKIHVDGLESGCNYESYLFSSVFAGFTILGYDVETSVNNLQVISSREVGGVHMVRSRLMGTFFEKSGDVLIIKALPTNAGVYSIVLNNFTFDGVGAISVEPISLEVSAKPVIAINAASICAGSNHTFVPVTTESGSFQWGGPNNLSVKAETLTASNAGIYSVTVIDANGCSASDTALLSVNQNPKVTINDTAVCKGSNLSLSALSADADLSYLWSNGQNTKQIVISKEGVYSVTATNASGCTGADTATVVLYDLPTIVIADTTICYGTGALSVDAGKFAAYKWSTGSTSRIETFNTNGDYSVAITDANGCKASDDFTFTVSDSIVFSLDTVFKVCTNTTLVLVEPGFETYNWNNTLGTDTYTFNGSSTAGSVFIPLSVVNKDGCEAEHSIRVEVLQDPSFTLSETDTVCNGGLSAIQISELTNTYTWSNGHVGNVAELEAGKYKVTATDANGCISVDSITVIERNEIIVDVQPSDTAFCFGGDAHLYATVSNCETCNFVWSTGDTQSSTIVGLEGSYSVTVTDKHGCTSLDSAKVTVHDVVSIENDTLKTCMDKSVVLSAGDYSAYLWDDGSDKSERTVTATGNYQVRVVASNEYGCNDTATISFVVNSNPTVQINDAVSCVSAEADSAQWELPILTAGTLSDGNIYSWSTGEVTNEITVSKSGNYIVTLTDSNGCQASDTAKVTINRFYYGDMNQSGSIKGSYDGNYDYIIMEDIFMHKNIIKRDGDFKPLVKFDLNVDGTNYLFQRSKALPEIVVSACWEFQADIDGVPGLDKFDLYALEDYIWAKDMPDLFSEYTGWPVLQQAPMPRNGRLKSDVTGYGDATMNIVFEDGQIIFKSDKPMRGIDIKLDTLQCKNLVWGKPTDLSKIASFITKETDQLWIEWTATPFNSTVTESIIALNYTGKLPDTMTFMLNYGYYVNQNMKAFVDTIVVVFEVPDTTATIDTTETTSAEALLLQQVTVRPVPAVSDIQVNASFCISNLFIQDALGRIVNEMSGVDADELSVDISSLPQGMYFLHVLGSNGEIAHTSFNKE